MARQPGSKNRTKSDGASDSKADEWDTVSAGSQRIVQWQEFAGVTSGDPRGAIAAHVIQTVREQLQELERIGVVAEFEPDAYSLRALKLLAAVRGIVSNGIHVIADASFAEGNISDAQIAKASGISASTVGKWRKRPVSFILKD